MSFRPQGVKGRRSACSDRAARIDAPELGVDHADDEHPAVGQPAEAALLVADVDGLGDAAVGRSRCDALPHMSDIQSSPLCQRGHSGSPKPFAKVSIWWCHVGQCPPAGERRRERVLPSNDNPTTRSERCARP